MTVECANCMHSVVRTLAGKAVLYCDLHGFPVSAARAACMLWQRDKKRGGEP